MITINGSSTFPRIHRHLHPRPRRHLRCRRRHLHRRRLHQFAGLTTFLKEHFQSKSHPGVDSVIVVCFHLDVVLVNSILRMLPAKVEFVKMVSAEV